MRAETPFLCQTNIPIETLISSSRVKTSIQDHLLLFSYNSASQSLRLLPSVRGSRLLLPAVSGCASASSVALTSSLDRLELVYCSAPD